MCVAKSIAFYCLFQIESRFENRIDIKSSLTKLWSSSVGFEPARRNQSALTTSNFTVGGNYSQPKMGRKNI